MPPAVAVAGIAAAGTIGGAVMGASAQKKAAKQASNTELQVAQQNNALAQQFRQENQANFQPNLNSGFKANSLIDSFLYGGAPGGYYPPATGTQGVPANETQAPYPGFPYAATAPGAAPAIQQHAQQSVQSIDASNAALGQPRQYGGIIGAMQHATQSIAQRAGNTDLSLAGNYGPGSGLNGNHISVGGGGITAQPPIVSGGTPQGTVSTPAPAGNPLAAGSGYQAFVNSPYFQFGQQQGLNALNNGYAARGLLESGDAMKGILKFGQDYGYSQGLMPYLGLAGDQANRGIQGASAIAGVGQNALANMTANNANAGNAAANAQLAKGAATAGMYSGIGSALGGLAGSAFGGMRSSYGGSSGGGLMTPNYPQFGI